MMALPLPVPDRPERRVGTRAGRAAVVRRRARTRRSRYAGLARIFAALGVVVFFVVLYLGLLANVTRMNYELTRLAERRAQLVDITTAGDDAIATAESTERLSAIARRLGMTEPQTFVSVALPRERPPEPRGIAFLGWLK
jgi:type II secretory pathway component PulM